jgi:hypothetical protein
MSRGQLRAPDLVGRPKVLERQTPLRNQCTKAGVGPRDPVAARPAAERGLASLANLVVQLERFLVSATQRDHVGQGFNGSDDERMVVATVLGSPEPKRLSEVTLRGLDLAEPTANFSAQGYCPFGGWSVRRLDLAPRPLKGDDLVVKVPCSRQAPRTSRTLRSAHALAVCAPGSPGS